MFRAVSLSDITNGRGVTVSLVDRGTIRYRRSGRILTLPCDCVGDRETGTANVVYLNGALRWHDDQPVVDADRAVIARDIVEAYKALGIETEVVG
jgi:hypothetical protein